MNYEVSRTTLADVFLKLEGKEAVDHKGKTLIPLCKFGMIKVLYWVFSLKINICKFLLNVTCHCFCQVKNCSCIKIQISFSDNYLPREV